MKIKVFENYEKMSEEAAKIVASQVILKPDSVIGLATGSTPLGMYGRLAQLCESGYVDFSEAKTFNLDEYYPIDPKNDQSYRYFMNKNLFDKINIKKENTHVPDGQTDDPAAFGKEYDKAICLAGGVDLQVLGIGRNGHIGFNEPGDVLYAGTHMTDLTADTIDANSRFFESADLVPKKAITMGMGTILKAKMILMLISGKNKHSALSQLLDDSIVTSNPATLIKTHENVVVLCDKDAYEG